MADSVETHVCARLMQRDIDIKNYLVKATTGLSIANVCHLDWLGRDASSLTQIYAALTEQVLFSYYDID